MFKVAGFFTLWTAPRVLTSLVGPLIKCGQKMKKTKEKKKLTGGPQAIARLFAVINKLFD